MIGEILSVEEGHRIIVGALRERHLTEDEMLPLLAQARSNKLGGVLHEMVQKGELVMWVDSEGEVRYGPPREIGVE